MSEVRRLLLRRHPGRVVGRTRRLRRLVDANFETLGVLKENLVTGVDQARKTGQLGLLWKRNKTSAYLVEM